MIIKYLLALFLFLSSLNAINVSSNEVKKSLLEDSEFFIDLKANLNINDIVKKEFKKTNSDYIRLGYTNHALWLKFSIKNNSKIPITRYLYLSNPIIDNITLFFKKENSYIKQTQGRSDFTNYIDENILHPTFKINFKAQEEKEFYLKTDSRSSANYFKLYLKDDINFLKDEYIYQLIEALFFGAMIALIIYNIFIYIFTKERAYLFYVLLVFFAILNHASYSLMINLVLGREYAYLDSFKNVYYISIATIMSLLFIRDFLNLQKNKVFNNISYIFIFILTLIMILNSKENYLMNVTSIVVSICVLYILYLSIYSYIKKTPEAQYILLGWIINITGIIAISLNQEGISNPIDVFPYFYEFTSFTEAILFSIALAAKLNKTKELESSLNTNKFLLKELHHRVKNNMQFIILLYRLKLSNLITPQIEEKLYETESSIQAMSKIHEILYAQKLEEINTKEYFEELISKIKYSQLDLNIDIKLEIKANLEVHQTVYSGIIINELITNCVKYAFKENIGEINILLINKNNKNILKIQDNGIGFNYAAQNINSFGLMFVEAMVKDELDGEIKFINDNGTKIEIIF
jgi:two-component sensor histidine kinase